MYYEKIFQSLFCYSLFAINTFSQTADKNAVEFDIEGHRGARGLAPENTTPAFLKASRTRCQYAGNGCRHQQRRQSRRLARTVFFVRRLRSTQSGKPIPKEKEKDYNIYKLTYGEIKKFDVGSHRQQRFSRTS